MKTSSISGGWQGHPSPARTKTATGTIYSVRKARLRRLPKCRLPRSGHGFFVQVLS